MTTKKRIQIFLTTTIFVIVCAIAMWYVFNNLKDKDLNIIDNPADETTEKFSEAEIIEFINNYQLEYFEKMETTFDKIDNQFKLILAYNHLIQNDSYNFQEGVPATLFENYLKNVFGRTYTIEHENIPSKQVTYNVEENKYTASKIIAEEKPNVILNRKNEYRVSNDNYIIAFAKAYSWDNETVYGNILDALARKNSIYKGEIKANFEETNYNELRKQIRKIKYTIGMERNKMILKNVEIND